MYCEKCGSQNRDDAMYCSKCGAPLKQVEENRVYRNMASPGVMGEVNLGLAGALRELIKSPLFLVAAIALSVQVISSVIAAATGVSSYVQALYEIVNNSGMGYYMDYGQLNALLGMLSRTSALTAVFANLPTIVVVAGLWILFAEARNGQRRMQTTGLTMIKIVEIIQLILVCAWFVLIIVGMFVGLGAVNRYGGRDADSYMIIVIVVILFLVCAAGLTILYYVKVIKTIGSAQSIILTGMKNSPASLYVIVLTFIAAGFQCISAFGSFVSAGFFGFLTNAAMGTSGIAFGLLMTKFNALEAFSPSMRQVGAPEQVQNHIPIRDVNVQAPVQQSEPGIYSYHSKPETVVMNYDDDNELRRKYANEGTMVLSENFEIPPAKLVRVKDQKEIRITKPEFTIGKAFGSVDCFLEDNPAISRKHAAVIYKEGNFYIVDTRSTNHVFVDGQMISPETPVLLKNGMKVRFADEVFDFYM